MKFDIQGIPSPNGLNIDRGIVYVELEKAFLEARSIMENFTDITPILRVDHAEFYKVLKYFRRKIMELDFAMHKELITFHKNITVEFSESYTKKIRELMDTIVSKLDNKFVRNELFHHFKTFTASNINRCFCSAEQNIRYSLNAFGSQHETSI